jgi:hypothetical protein
MDEVQSFIQWFMTMAHDIWEIARLWNGRWYVLRVYNTGYDAGKGRKFGSRFLWVAILQGAWECLSD